LLLYCIAVGVDHETIAKQPQQHHSVVQVAIDVIKRWFFSLYYFVLYDIPSARAFCIYCTEVAHRCGLTSDAILSHKPNLSSSDSVVEKRWWWWYAGVVLCVFAVSIASTHWWPVILACIVICVALVRFNVDNQVVDSV